MHPPKCWKKRNFKQANCQILNIFWVQYEEIKNIEAVLSVVLKFVEICRENNVGNKLLLQIFSSSDVDQKKKKVVGNIQKYTGIYAKKFTS